MTIGTPMGANSKSANGSRPYFGSRPLTARLVGDPARVHLPPSTAPNASGIRNIEAGVLRRLAMAITPGIKTAVVTTLLMKAAIEEAVNIMMISNLLSPSPANRWSLWPMASTTPVLKSAAEMTKKLVSVMITGSPNPRKASAGVMTRPTARESSIRIATMSIGSASVTYRIIAISRMMKTNAIATLIAQYKFQEKVLPLFVPEGRWILAGGETTGAGSDESPRPGRAPDQSNWSVALSGLGAFWRRCPGGFSTG